MAVQTAMAMQSIAVAKKVMAVGVAATKAGKGRTENGAKRDFADVLSFGRDSIGEAKGKIQDTSNGNQKKAEAVTASSVQTPKKPKTDAEPKIAESEPIQSDEALEQTAKENGESKDEPLSKDILSGLVGLLNELVTVMKEFLSMDEEELLDAAGGLELQLTDLFDIDKMKAFFLQVNGAEAPELLVNETLYQSFESFQAAWESILEEGQPVLQEASLLMPQEATLNKELASFLSSVMTEGVNEVETGKDEALQQTELVIDFKTTLQTKNTEQFADTLFGNAGAKESLPVTSHGGEEASFTFGKENDGEASKQSLEQASLFLQKLMTVGKENGTEGISSVTGGFEALDIAAQIIEQVKLQIRPEHTKMELQLNPESLGKVELSITSKNGELSAKMNVQNDQVKEAVEAQMQVLRETLEAQGLKVESIEVTVMEFGFRFQDDGGEASKQQSRQQQRNNRAFTEDSMAEEQSFSDVSDVMRELNGNSVDYVA